MDKKDVGEIMDTVSSLTKSVRRSLVKYVMAGDKAGHAPYAGYEVDREDSKESIKRRITVIREELLKISKSL